MLLVLKRFTYFRRCTPIRNLKRTHPIQHAHHLEISILLLWYHRSSGIFMALIPTPNNSFPTFKFYIVPIDVQFLSSMDVLQQFIVSIAFSTQYLTSQTLSSSISIPTRPRLHFAGTNPFFHMLYQIRNTQIAPTLHASIN